jgi:hypothetical protein
MAAPLIPADLIPAELLDLGFDTLFATAEAGTVIGMRLLGLAGLWPVDRDETLRMLAEKPAALQDALLAGASALWNGAPPGRIVAAGLAPLARAVRANRRRLAGASQGGKG